MAKSFNKLAICFLKLYKIKYKLGQQFTQIIEIFYYIYC